MAEASLEPLRLGISFHHRVWGGRRLKQVAPGETPVGEAWLVHEHNRVQGGRFDGQTLEALSTQLGANLLGVNAVARTGTRFPLLLKLLDCADWLSIQVHPNDTQAVQLEGAGHFGKTEAWHLLEVEPGAELIAGVKAGVSPAALATAIREGTVLEVAQRQTVRAGDTIMMQAGTMHALGPGMLLYEVQQTSDLTYRVFDWDRPASAGRALHIEQSVAVTTTNAASVQHAPPLSGTTSFSGTTAQPLTTCPYFILERLQSDGRTDLKSNTDSQSFHALTVTEGTAQLRTHSGQLSLSPYETLIVPAAFGAYTLSGTFKALRSSVPM
jgi:mannose-6-phosphate isomerase